MEMEQDGRQSVVTQVAQDQKSLAPSVVVMPSEAIEPESRSEQPKQSSIVVSQIEQPAAMRSEQQVSAPVITNSSSGEDKFPVGMSASQIGLDVQKNRKRIYWRMSIRNGIYPLAMLIVVFGGLLFWRHFSDMATKTLSIGGYTYSFSFFRDATYEQVNGSGFQGYTVNGNIAATVRPQSTNLVPFCSEMGDQYTEAFTVQVYGTTRPVCTAQNNLGTQVYYLGFTALNKNHGFAITYNKSQNAKVYPKLKSIFESVRVTKTNN
jgi:hypothetical protein